METFKCRKCGEIFYSENEKDEHELYAHEDYMDDSYERHVIDMETWGDNNNGDDY